MLIFQWLENWLANDILHFNLFVGMTTFIMLFSIVVIFTFFKKIKLENEKTYLIKLKIGYHMYSSLLVLLTVCILWMPAGIIYFRQYIIMIISLSLLVGAISTIYYYQKQMVSGT
ncbi:hypothetical protein AAG068_18520 [Bacillus paramycoides]|uniref:hypothetical protein n=1 Tax=Bacillus paramycoides TaxID=2026194 RepID=UPI0031845C37